MRKKQPLIAASPSSAVIYARFSSHNQKDESIEQQVAECKLYANTNGLNVVGVYADAAVSGKTDNRAQFQRLKSDAKKGKFAVIIAYKSNRIARNMANALNFENDMDSLGIRVAYAKEEFGDNAAGRFALRMMMNMNQFYAENLAEDTIRGMLDNAEKCKVNGPVPYGYRSDKGNFAVNLEEAAVVREIFVKTARGESFVDIAESLNARGILTRQKNRWSSRSFQSMLKNERYIGTYIFDKIRIENGIPAIIDKDLFMEVNEKLKEKPNPQGRHRINGDYLLSGKLYCGECGKPMMGMSGHSKSGTLYFYYNCIGKKTGENRCQKKNVRRDDIELRIAEAIKMYILQDEVINWIADTVMEYQATHSNKDEIKRLQAELSATKKKINNILDAIEQGILTPGTKERLESLETDKQRLEGQIAIKKSELPLINREKLLTWLHSFSEEDIEDKNIQAQLFKSFLERVYLYDDGRIRIQFNLYDNVSTKDFRTLDLDSTSTMFNVRLKEKMGHQKSSLLYIQRRVFFVPSFQKNSLKSLFCMS